MKNEIGRIIKKEECVSIKVCEQVKQQVRDDIWDQVDPDLDQINKQVRVQVWHQVYQITRKPRPSWAGMNGNKGI